MYFYEIALLNSPLHLLTYSSDSDLDVGCEVNIKLRNRLLTGVVISSVTKPDFHTSLIESATTNYFSSTQIFMAKFIAEYYFCSLGEALNLFVPFKGDECAVGTVNDESEMVNGEKRIYVSTP